MTDSVLQQLVIDESIARKLDLDPRIQMMQHLRRVKLILVLMHVMMSEYGSSFEKLILAFIFATRRSSWVEIFFLLCWLCRSIGIVAALSFFCFILIADHGVCHPPT